MEAATQIIAAIVAGIFGSFLLGFILRHIFTRLDKKADLKAMEELAALTKEKLDVKLFEEYSKRVADNLDSGKRRFDKIDSGLEKNTEAVNRLCVEFGEVKTTIDLIAKKLP